MCDSQSYPDYCSGCTSSVNAALSAYSLTEDSRSKLETCFLNGCYGEDNSNVLLTTEEVDAGNDCNAAGVTWRSSNPDKPLPPKP